MVRSFPVGGLSALNHFLGGSDKPFGKEKNNQDKKDAKIKDPSFGHAVSDGQVGQHFLD
jgi:hypothetical protein